MTEITRDSFFRRAAIVLCLLLLLTGVCSAVLVLRRYNGVNRADVVADRLRESGCSVARDQASDTWIVLIDTPAIDDRSFRELRDDLFDLEPLAVSFGRASRVTNKSLEALVDHENIRSLVLQSPGFTDEALASVSSMGSVRDLVMSAPGFRNQCLKGIARLPCLTTLTLGRSSFERGCLMNLGRPLGLEMISCMRLRLEATDISSLSAVPRLRALHLLRCDVEARDLAGLVQVRQLRKLWIVGADLTSDIRFVRELTQLNSLALESCTLARSVFDDLCKLPRLQHLSLRYSTPTDDEAVAAIACLDGLTSLDLSSTEVTDRCIPSLMTMRNLREVGLEETNVSNDAVGRLRSSMVDSER